MEFCDEVRPGSFSLGFQNSIGLCSGNEQKKEVICAKENENIALQEVKDKGATCKRETKKQDKKQTKGRERDRVEKVEGIRSNKTRWQGTTAANKTGQYMEKQAEVQKTL